MNAGTERTSVSATAKISADTMGLKIHVHGQVWAMGQGWEFGSEQMNDTTILTKHRVWHDSRDAKENQ